MSDSPQTDLWRSHNEQVIACRRCPRLVEWREQVAREKRRAFREWEYWGKPVPAFGDPAARVLIVGLAPGAHGSNRTGRMFTGDSSGDFLYAALHRAGFANQPTTHDREDGLALTDLMITAVCRCVPPDNKPTPQEMLNCRPFLLAELDLLPGLAGIVCLGKIAFDNVLSVLRLRGLTIPPLAFGHGAFYRLATPTTPNAPWLLACYHPSRQNTQTGRLTVEMYDQVWSQVRQLLTGK